jgi:N-acetylglucosamine-6-phosphate deacetylase
MIQLAEVPLIEAVRMASETPARILGIDTKKGTIALGKDADLVIFDQEINVRTTIINGAITYDA